MTERAGPCMMCGSMYGVKRGCFVVAILACLLFIGAVPSFSDTASFPLQYYNAGFNLEISIPLEGAEFVFKKEPDFGKRKITRGAIPVGRDKSRFIGFAWDQDEAKLHLDLNRNLDLTDDEGSPFSSGDREWGQAFSGITIQADVGGKTIPYNVTMHFWKWPGMTSGRLTVLSGWGGEVALEERKWRLAFVDNLDGELGEEDQFILAPHDQPFEHSQLNTVKASQRLCLDGRLYRPAIFAEGEGSDLRMAFSEWSEPMAEVAFEGQHVRRLVLEGPALVVAEWPAEKLVLPVGTYGRGRVFLDAGQGVIYEAQLRKSIEVARDGSTRLRAGGPLNQTVDITRYGSRLSLNYRLEGVDGERYSRMDQTSASKPRVVITRNGKQVASGTFEYG